MLSKRIPAILLSGALASLAAFAQENYRSEASIQAFGSFVKSTVSDGVEQSATNSGGVLASYRFFFRSNQGVEVNYGYALNTQSYGLAGGSLGLRTGSHEATAAYVFRLQRAKWSPFALAGAGGLVFDPRDVSEPNWQARPAFVYGAGTDFRVSNRIFIRAQYRGLVYKSPTYDLAALNGLDRFTHRAEPSLGFGFKF